ncbi:hypothetical protein ACJJWD_14155 [Comamonas testosteroni]|uniref:hypothetical protein n=1 Tax=Comamonas testosteroni TaxID=285 RepID=UPI00389A9443
MTSAQGLRQPLLISMIAAAALAACGGEDNNTNNNTPALAPAHKVPAPVPEPGQTPAALLLEKIGSYQSGGKPLLMVDNEGSAAMAVYLLHLQYWNLQTSSRFRAKPRPHEAFCYSNQAKTAPRVSQLRNNKRQRSVYRLWVSIRRKPNACDLLNRRVSGRRWLFERST